MKILIIPEYGTYGGTFSFFKRLLNIHQKHHLETGVLIEKQQQTPDAMKAIKEAGCEIYVGANRKTPFRNPYLTILYDLVFCCRAYRSFRPNIIVISNGNPGFLAGTLFFPVPVLFVMHTYPTQKFVFPVRLLWHLAGRLRNRFVSVSRYSVRCITRNLGVPQDQIEVVYNSFKSVQPDIRNKLPVVLTIGHVVSYKNPEVWLNVALKVIVRHPDVRFYWLGEGDLLEPLRHKVRILDLEDRIVFKGYCDQVENYYAEALVYFQPSFQESHGISVVEAMAHGLPCVTSDVGGLPESVGNGETGFTCPPDDVEGFATRIIELVDDRALRDKMGTAGKQRAELLFSEAVQEVKILNLYQSMIKHGNVI